MSGNEASAGGQPPERLNYHHEAIIDLMLSQPDLKKGEIAEKLGYTQAWVSTVTNSDMFKVAYRQRRAELHAGINERIVQGLAEIDEHATQRVLSELKHSDCSPEFALKAKESALERLGYGTSKNGGGTGGGPSPDAALSPEELQAARQVIHDVTQYYRRNTYEGEVVEGETVPVGQEVEDPPVESETDFSEDYPPAEDSLQASEGSGQEFPERD